MLFSLLCCFEFSEICLGVVYFHTLCGALGRAFMLESHVLQFWKKCCNYVLNDFLLFFFSLLGSFCYMECSSNSLIFHAYSTYFVLFLFWEIPVALSLILPMTPAPNFCFLAFNFQKLLFILKFPFSDNILFLLFCCSIFSYLSEDVSQSCEVLATKFLWPFPICPGLQLSP